MAVIYLFDAKKNFRKIVKRGVQEIIHSEGEYEAIAEILAKDAPAHGDHFGFWCADGRFRLFAIKNIETDDETQTCMFSGPDAAIAELEGMVLTNLSLQNTTALNAITEALRGTGWTVGRQTGDGQVNTESAYFATRWAAIKKAAAAGGVRVVPYYDFEGGAITGRRVDVLDKTPVFSGLIYTRKRGAQNIKITREGRPYGRVYPIGKIIGSSEPPEQITIADVAWSIANGDPVDKPAGQLYIDLPGALTNDEYVYEDKRETDAARLMKKAFEDLKRTQTATASGTANISEMERIPGYEHMVAQMWMMAVIRAENGEMVDTTIINIERYHVHTELTQITIGDEKASEDALENMLADMRTDLLDAARVAGGGRAKAGKAEEMVLEAEKKIQLNSAHINLRAFTADVEALADDTEVRFKEVYVDIDTGRAEISATKTIVNNITNEVETINATLTVQAGKIEAKADRIELEGYVTLGVFEAEMLTIEDIFAGRTQVDYLYANQAVGAQYGSFTNVTLINYEADWKDLTMGEVKPGISFLGKKIQENIDLEHSHKVSVDEATGLVTLGEVSETGGNFNIADTTFYKNGVSAARNSGYASGKTDWSPVSIERTDYSAENKNVTVRAMNAAGVPLISLETIDASEIWQAGYDAAADSGGGSYDDGYNAGYQAAKNAVKIGYNSFTITNTAANTFFAQASIWAKIDGETVQSTTITKTQNINVGQ